MLTISLFASVMSKVYCFCHVLLVSKVCCFCQVLLLLQEKEEEGWPWQVTGGGAVLTGERSHCGAAASVTVAVQ